MAITINAKATSNDSFRVGKDGITVNKDGSIDLPDSSDFTLNLDEGYGLVLNPDVSDGIITTTADKNLVLDATVGGGDHLLFNGMQWPDADGTINQVLSTDGNGVLSWTSAGSGTVTSVSLSAPPNFSITGSPVTSSGTLEFGYTHAPWNITNYTMESNADWNDITIAGNYYTSGTSYTNAAIPQSSTGLLTVYRRSVSAGEEPLSQIMQVWKNYNTGEIYTRGKPNLVDWTAWKKLAHTGDTMTDPLVINANSSSDALRITQVGAGNALVIEDAANPDATPFVIDGAGDVGVARAPITGTKFTVNQGSNVTTDYTGVRVENSAGNYGFGIGAYGMSNRVNALNTTVNYTIDIGGALAINTGGTQRFAISSAGNAALGGASGSNVNFYNRKDITGSATSYANYTAAPIRSDVTTAAYGYVTGLGTEAADFTLPALAHFRAAQLSIGAGSSVTNQFGFRAEASLTGAASNYGFYGDIPNAAGRWNFYANGTAENFFQGITTFASRSSHAGAYTPSLLPTHSATPTFNCATSNVFEPAVMTSNVTSITMSNPAAGQTVQIRFQQDGTGGRTVAVPASSKIDGTPNTAANRVNWLIMTYSSRASRWEGNWLVVPA